MAPYQDYLIARWNEGCRNARQLYRELTEEQGYTASYANVERFLMQFRTNGQVEGQVHRLKLLKRQAYGRASFETLRKRVLRRA